MANTDSKDMGDNLLMASRPNQWRRTTIREHRLAKGMSLAELAQAMEMNEGYLSGLENGRRRYNQDILEKAAKIFDVPVSHLLTRKPLPKDFAAIDYSDPAVAAAAMDELDDADRRRIAGVIASYHKTIQ
jgi:transcriptional regulator with XRE-family HTH domain